MSDGHRTSTIARPRQTDAEVNSASPRRDQTTTRSRVLSDLTSPIPVDKRLVQRRRNRWVLGLFATLIVAALAASVFVFPMQSWLKQRGDLKVRQSEQATLDAANNDIQSEVDRLQTNEGIKEAARKDIGYVEQGEKQITVIGAAGPSVILPTGWPYDLITEMVHLRRQEAAAQAAAATTIVAPNP